MSDIQRLTAEQVEAIDAVPLGHMPNRLRVAMGVAKVRQVDIAKATGLAPAVVSDIVNGKYSTQLPLETCRPFAEFFGCPIEVLFPARAAQAVAS